jgi:hypothetical protein
VIGFADAGHGIGTALAAPVLVAAQGLSGTITDGCW